MTETDIHHHQLRDEYPSGWIALTQNRSIPYIIDALLDAQPHREFNQSELARASGVTRQSVAAHIDLLLQLGVINLVENTTPSRYRLNQENPVTKAIIDLEIAMNESDPITS